MSTSGRIQINSVAGRYFTLHESDQPALDTLGVLRDALPPAQRKKAQAQIAMPSLVLISPPPADGSTSKPTEASIRQARKMAALARTAAEEAASGSVLLGDFSRCSGPGEAGFCISIARLDEAGFDPKDNLEKKARAFLTALGMEGVFAHKRKKIEVSVHFFFLQFRMPAHSRSHQIESVVLAEDTHLPADFRAVLADGKLDNKAVQDVIKAVTKLRDRFAFSVRIGFDSEVYFLAGRLHDTKYSDWAGIVAGY